ncbi:MAG: tetratricopeptide repeat protein [Candidatus Helarchaeota archaeon]
MEKIAQILKDGISLVEKAKYAKAIPKLEKALEGLLKTENKELISLCRSFLGLAYRAEKKYEAALDQFQAFLNLITAMSDRFGIAQAYLDLGMTLSLQKDYEQAIVMLQKSLKIIQEDLKDRDLEVTALANLGGVFLLKGDIAAARQYYKEGVKIADKFDFVEGAAECYRGLGEIYKTEGKLKQSEDNFLNSLALYRLMRDKRAQADIIQNLGTIYLENGKAKEAKPYFTQALKLKKKLNDLVGQKICEKNIELIDKILSSLER